jgi:hypothetical protein
MLLKPGKQRAGVVQSNVDARMFFEDFKKREIAGVVGFFENVLKIAAGLMGVDDEREMETLGRRGHCFSQPS